MRNPLTWLFGFVESANPDVIGRFKLTADEIGADRLTAHEQKIADARAYMAKRGLKVKPMYRTRAKEAA